MKGEIKVGLVQMACGLEPSENLKRAVEQIHAAASKGAQVVCLPELFRTQYFCQEENVSHFNYSEPVPGPTSERLQSTARELGIVIIAPIFEKRAEGIYHNSAVVLNPSGETAGTYRKMHIPDDPFYYEKFYFTPGDLGFCAHRTPFGAFGVLICWDQWFPEAARLTALAGAQILFYPTAIGWTEGQDEATNEAQHSAWEIVQRSHAVVNGLFVVVVNRVGKEDHIDFWGRSFVCDPIGRLIARASHDHEETLVVRCDVSRVETTRREWCFLRDRRIDAYQDLVQRFIDTRDASR